MAHTNRREQIAENVRAAKARRRVTDAEIADAIGIARGAVNERMNGRARWQVEELEAVATFLGTTLADLLEVPSTAEVAS